MKILSFQPVSRSRRGGNQGCEVDGVAISIWSKRQAQSSYRQVSSISLGARLPLVTTFYFFSWL